MTVEQSLFAFTLAALVLAATPGIDTALVLRMSISAGARRGLGAALGIAAGCLLWGAVVATGLGALLAASDTVFTIVKLLGAAYLVWQGVLLLRSRGLRADAPALAASGETVGSAFAGIWGMNFAHMPELEWRYGYLFGLGIIASASAFLWWRFRKAKWL